MQVERLKLDTTIQIQQFYKWVMANGLTPAEISLWHALLYIADDAGYPVWLSVAVSRLEKLTGMKKDALYTARDNLEMNGLIEIQTGRGNQAAKYRLVPFPEEYQELPDEVKLERIPIESEESSTEDPQVEPTIEGRKIQFYTKIQQIIPFPASKDTETIKEYMSDGMEDELVCEGVNIIFEKEEFKDKKPMDKWRYYMGILRNWRNDGILTYEQYQKHERDREERLKNGGNKQSYRPVQPESNYEQKPSGMREFRIPGEE